MVVVTLICRELARSRSRFRLDTPLGDLLEDAKGGPLAAATVAQLLGHASGAQAWADFYADTTRLAQRPAERSVAIRSAVLGAPLLHPRGQQAVYSDLGFMALGWALEAALGAPLDELFARGVAAPLGLSDCGFRRLSQGPRLPVDGICATEIWAPRCADGRPLKGVVHDDNCSGLDGVAGHAGLFASLADVLRWAEAWLLAARGMDTDALKPAAVNALISASAAPDTTWRLGWDTPSAGGSSAGQRVSAGAFGHLGFTGTSAWIDPVRGAAVVLLTNRVHPSREPHGPIKTLRPGLHDAVWDWLSVPRPAE